MRVVTPEEMALADGETIRRERVPGLVLMERAGQAVARAAVEMFHVAGGRVNIWCGKGNNGGDGFVVARLLQDAGAVVRVLLPADPGGLAGDAAGNYARLGEAGVEAVPLAGGGPGAAGKAAGECDLSVDAIFGTGFKGRAEGVYAEAIGAINGQGGPVLSVDIPSGVDGLTGAADGPSVRADRTVTFAALKVGLVQYPGAGLAGAVEVADIGIPERVLESVSSSRIELIEGPDADDLLPERPPDIHKRQAGSLLVVGGSPGLTGAPVLCSRAALRSGAGVVTLGVPEGLHDVVEIKTTEVMTVPLAQTGGRTLSEAGARQVLEMCGSYDTLVVGPGISRDPETGAAVRRLVSDAPLPVVLDADGLDVTAGNRQLISERPHPTILTPHPGEMATLLGVDSRRVQADRVGTARRAAGDFRCVVVLKGANTVVAEPGGSVRIADTGNPGMATAGMGDVLAGCIAALMAQGLEAFDAASAGVWFHGMAGDMAAEMGGMIGMTAGDVINSLPLALRRPLRR